MAFRNDPPTIAFDQLKWDLIGEEDPQTRLLAHIRIGNLDMHLEAREVTTTDQGWQTTKDYPSDHEAMVHLSDVPSFQTATIGGREYFLYALPYGD